MHFLFFSPFRDIPCSLANGSLLSSKATWYHLTFSYSITLIPILIVTSPSLILTLLHPSFTYKDTCDYSGPTQVNQDNISISMVLSHLQSPLFHVG